MVDFEVPEVHHLLQLSVQFSQVDMQSGSLSERNCASHRFFRGNPHIERAASAVPLTSPTCETESQKIRIRVVV